MQRPYLVRGIRGATTATENGAGQILDATRELLKEMLAVNGIDDFSLIASIIFSATKDLTAAFPAAAARDLGMTAVPLLGTQESDVKGGLERCIRVLVLVNSQLKQDEVRHVYLHGAKSLRPDLSEELET